MRILFLIFTFCFPLFALSDSYKIVIDTFKTKTEARQAYQKDKNNSKSALLPYSNAKQLIIHTRKSGDKHIIAIEPFSSREEAQAVLKDLSPFYPHVFVSRGVADDIEFLLMQHRKDILIPKPLPKEPIKPLVLPKKETINTQVPNTIIIPSFSSLFLLDCLGIFSGENVC